MTLDQLIPLLLQVSVGAVVFAIGLRTAPGDITSLLRRPSLLLRSLLAMLVLMPLLVAALAAAFDLRPEVELALLLLAVSPVPPVLPGKQAKAGGDFSYAIGLLAASGAIASVTAPLTVKGIVAVFGRDVHVPMATVARTIALTVFAPLIAGTLVRGWRPALAARASRPLSAAASILLAVAFIPIVVSSWHAILAQMGQRSGLAIVAFIVAGVIVGHVLGGPEDDDRTVLALATASRHPGVALAIAASVASDRGAVSAVVLLALLLGAIVTRPYVKWRTRTTPARTP